MCTKTLSVREYSQSLPGKGPGPRGRPHDRLSVVFVTSWYPTREHPIAGVFIREHAKAVQLYDDVLVIHTSQRAGLHGWWQLDEERDDTLAEGVLTYRLWYRKTPFRATSFLLRAWGLVGAMRVLRGRGVRPNLLHAHIYDSAAATVLASLAFRLPLVLTEQASAFLSRLRGASLLVARLAFRAARVSMPVSRHLEMATRRHGIGGEFRVLPNVVDLDLFHPPKRATDRPPVRQVLFVGLLDLAHKKGIPSLLRVLAERERHRRDWHLDVVGDGPARQYYERMVADLGIGGRVSFHGLRAKPVVAQLMREADVFVLPSLYETFGCVLIEAMASGLPIVSTSTGAIPDLVDSETGILVPPGDAAALASAIEQMLSSLHKYDRQAIAQKARRFSPEVVGATIDTVYREVLGLSGHEHRVNPRGTDAHLAGRGRLPGAQP